MTGKMEIKILHLYYDLLNLYGDYGNVVIMKKHLEDQGFSVSVEKKTLGDEVNFDAYDFIYIGCGTEKNLDVAMKDLKKYVNEINIALEKKKVFLCTGNSFEMFGKKIDSEEGLAIFSYETVRQKERVVADCIYRCDFLEKEVVGFVNKMTEMFHNMSPFFQVEYGAGENRRNDYEGVKFLNFYGTHISGPILSRNPEFLKHLVKEIGKQKNRKFEYKEIPYEYEEKSYELVLSELKKRMETGEK